MEQNPNDVKKTEPPRRRKPKKAAIPVPKFLSEYISHLGNDVRWYFDIRLWSPLILILLILAIALPGKGQKQQEVPQATEPTVAETQPVTEPTETPVNEEASALAALADSVGIGRSNNVKTVIMWVAINRSEDRSNGYGLSLLEEIARPNQWQGYDATMPYMEETYELALSVLAIRDNGGLRPVDSDMLWLVLNDDGSITLRNQFTATANQKWREKTVK